MNDDDDDDDDYGMIDENQDEYNDEYDDENQDEEQVQVHINNANKYRNYISDTSRSLGKSALNIGSMMKNKFNANKGRMTSAAKSVGRSVANTIGNIIKCVGNEAFKDTQDGGKKIRYVRKRRSSSKKSKKRSSSKSKRRISSKKNKRKI
jgi:hypothetical protein